MPTIEPTVDHPAPVEADYEAENVLVVAEPLQLRALADDLRATLIALLRERARSTQELAVELGLPKGTVGHHLKVLERAGLIRVVRTRRVRAVTEKYYGRVARLFLIRTGDAPETTGPLAAAGLRRAADELEVSPGQDALAFGVVRARLSKADGRRFERRLAKLMEDVRAAETPDGRGFVLATAFYPRDADA